MADVAAAASASSVGLEFISGAFAGVDSFCDQVVPSDFKQREVVGQQKEPDRDEVVPLA